MRRPQIPNLRVLLGLMVCALLSVLSAPLHAQQLSPAIIYSVGKETETENLDHAFNASARRGVERAEEEFSIDVKEYYTEPGEERAAVFSRMIGDGANMIIAVGFPNAMPVMKLAEEYPNVRFTVIDGIVPPLFNNVQSVIFKDNEGAFLVGMVAALTTRSNHIGFIGGMDMPIIRNFAYGYTQGAQFANPEVQISQAMIGSDNSAWNNPKRASELARSMYTSDDVDIIFAAAGGSNIGVINAAAETNRLAIGVDTNQNGLQPGHVLTSMVKRVDNTVYEALKQAVQYNWEAGIKSLGLRERAIDYAVDQHNRTLVRKEVVDKVEAARDLIVRGILEVKNYSPK